MRKQYLTNNKKRIFSFFRNLEVKKKIRASIIDKHVYLAAMTEAEHNRPIPKLFDNRPSASATEVFVEIIRPIIEEAWLMKS